MSDKLRTESIWKEVAVAHLSTIPVSGRRDWGNLQQNLGQYEYSQCPTRGWNASFRALILDQPVRQGLN
jgi:hypothetical protein